MEENEITVLSLSDFIKRYPLPETGCVQATRAEVMCNSLGQTTVIAPGDVLLFRSVTIESIKVSYYDQDFYRREVRLAGNFPGKFLALNISEENGKDEMIIFRSVEDLAKECPTYFRATINSHLGRVKFKAGDRFRLLKVHYNSRGRCVIECRHMDGRQLHLSHDVVGNFEALNDSNYYTVGELANIAAVSRRIKLAPDSINNMYPLDGVPNDSQIEFLMHEPKYIVHLSPLSCLTNIFVLPLKTKIKLCLVTVNDVNNKNQIYNAVRFSLAQFAKTYSQSFPVECRIESYPDIPKYFQSHFEIKSNIGVLFYEKIEKLLAKSRDNCHFVLSRRLNAKCRFLPRTYSCVVQLLKCSLNTKLEVEENVKTEQPRPLSLRKGDIIRIITNVPCLKHVKRNWLKSNERIPVLKCEHLNKKGESQFIKLPLDLDINVTEVVPEECQRTFAFHHLFDDKPELPMDVELVHFEGSDLPLICYLTLQTFIRDPCLIASVNEPNEGVNVLTKRNSSLNYLHRDGPTYEFPKYLEIPDRHCAALSFLGTMYAVPLIFPTKDEIIDVTVEKISRKVFSDLEKGDMSYQNISLAPPDWMTQSFKPRQRPSRPISMISLRQIARTLSNITQMGGRKSIRRNNSLDPLTSPNSSTYMGHQECNNNDRNDDSRNKIQDDEVYEDVVFRSVSRCPPLPIYDEPLTKKFNIGTIFPLLRSYKNENRRSLFTLFRRDHS